MDTSSPLLLLIAGISTIMLLEKAFPNRPLPPSKGWKLRLLIVYIFIVIYLIVESVTWAPVFHTYSIFNLKESLSPPLGGFIAYLGWSFSFYWWHRWCHANDTLWRVVHQLHHSPKRIQALTAYFVHPFDYATSSILGGLIVFMVMGMGLDAATYMFAYSTIFSFFIHSNLKMPQWVGYVIQTPDMHRIHHKINHHQSNYGVLVLWDQLFGTYAVPEEPVEECGYIDDKEYRFKDILLCRDVHKT